MKKFSMKKMLLRRKEGKSIFSVFAAAIFIFSMISLFAKDEVEKAVKENLKKTKEEAKA